MAHRQVHHGYAGQLRVETVPEWVDGYIPWEPLLAKIDAVVVAAGAGSGEALHQATEDFTNSVKVAIAESGGFFAKELFTIQQRFAELGGHLSSPMPNPGGVEFLPERHYTATRASEPGPAGCATKRSTVTQRIASVVVGGNASQAPQRSATAVTLTELSHVAEKLLRFAEVQDKTVRHLLDGVARVMPSYDGAAAVRHAFASSELDTLRSMAAVTREDIRAKAAASGAADAGPLAAAAGASAAESYNWVIKWHFVAIAAAVLAIVRLVPIFDSDDAAAHSCAAIIGCVATLWISEAMPFFATALLIPLLAVPLNALPGLNHHDTGVKLLGATFDHTQILVLGGLCLGKAVAKHQLERQIARFVLRPVASRPWLYLLVVMLVSVLMCAVISNVAAPVLVMSIVQPSLWELDDSTGAPQAILLGVAFACNLGGMLTPIASPQNAVAQQALGAGAIPFVRWFAAALPIVLIGTFAAWAVVILLWRPFDDVDFIPIPLAKTVLGSNSAAGTVSEGMHGAPPTAAYGTVGDGGHIEHVRAAEEGEQQRAASATAGGGGHTSTHSRAHSGPHHGDSPLLEHTSVPASASTEAGTGAAGDDDAAQRKEARREICIIIAVLVITVVLWCVPEDAILGDTGVVALIPIVVFFGVGILKKADFNSLSWHLIFLLSGGNMLGLMSRESHLLEIVINQLRPFLESHGTFAVVAVLISSVALVTTFVSHTVASLLLMPVIVEVSQVNPSLPSSAALVFLSVIMCSGSMAFPITSFPNVNSLLTESAGGVPYLIARHFLLPGLCMSALVLAQLTTYMVYYAEALFPRGV